MELDRICFSLLADNVVTPYDITPSLMGYEPHKDFDKLLALCEALKSNQHVKLLDLSGCDLTDEQLIQLLDLLKENTSIEILCLNANKLEDSSIEAIADFINLKGLKVVTFHSNEFTKAGLERLKEAIPCYPELQERISKTITYGLYAKRAATPFAPRKPSLFHPEKKAPYPSEPEHIATDSELLATIEMVLKQDIKAVECNLSKRGLNYPAEERPDLYMPRGIT